MVTNILLCLLLLAAVTGIVAAAFVYRRVSGIARDYEAQFRTFISPTEDGQPSPLARVTDAAASMLARAVVAQAKTTLMGIQSGMVRAEKAVEGDIAEGMAEGTPVGALLGSFPALRKTLRRNPALLDVAMSFLAQRMGKGGGGGLVASGNGNKPRFSLG